MLTALLQQLMAGEHLSEDVMAQAMGSVMDGGVSQVQMAAFLVALRMKGETIDEICGAARAMRQRMTPIHVAQRPLMDTCGTGGDGAHTFNISTTVAFVLAACGLPVAKHGNRAVSSRSGSADVLQELGINIAAPKHVVEACVTELGIGFLFAPMSHPAMANAAPVRKELGVRTIFNVLGPLTNPASASHQLLGVYDRRLVRPLAAVLGRLGSSGAWVVHGADGQDELSLADTTYVAQLRGREVIEFTVTPEEAGLARCRPEDLRGGDAHDNAHLLRAILAGERPGPQQDVVAYNAGAGLMAAGMVQDLRQGVQRAQEAMRDGRAHALLQRLIERSQAA